MRITKHLLLEDDMLSFSGELAECVTKTIQGPFPNLTLFLSGGLGAGKTTFARGFLRGLGFSGKVKSPTYTLVEPYDFSNHQVFHFDFYRVSTLKELEEIGIHEYFASNTICLIEWPEKAFSLLPQPDLTCYIHFTDNARELNLEAHSEPAKRILHKGLLDTTKLDC